AAGGIAVMAVIVLRFAFPSPSRIRALHYEVGGRLAALLLRSVTLVLRPVPRLYRLENEHENDTEHDESELEERHFREYVWRPSAADVLEDDEAHMIQSVFEMDDTLVRAVMRPRIDVVWLDSGTSLDDAVEIFIA